jgi:flagellar basal-body rod protein FlgG
MDYVTVVLSMALNNDMQELNAISQNLANINTDAYKREVPYVTTFQSALESGVGSVFVAQDSLPAGGELNVNVSRDMQQGVLQYSGSAFDVALQGDGFFEVETEQGTQFTRKGHLALDAQGRLVLATGEPLLGEGGAIYLRNSPFSIDASGVVSQDGFDLDRLSLTRIENPAGLAYQGEGMFTSSSMGAAQRLPFEGQVMQGYVESSNVRSTDEMIRLIELTRHFETTQRVLQGYDGMLDQAINSLGDL